MSKTTIITGSTGSGKTEFCLNLALSLRAQTNQTVYIADLDVVNPYFRSRERRESLKRHGIEIVGDAMPEDRGRDIPALSFGFLPLIEAGEEVLIDLAGGAIGLHLLADCYDRLGAFAFLCVLNLYREETNTREKMIRFLAEIHASTKLEVTGLVNNSHMIHHTEPAHVLKGQEVILDVSNTLGIPLTYTQVKRQVFEKCKDEIQSEHVLVFETLQMRESWQ